VLRSAQSTKPTKNILEKAAAIVAYYSKARNATYTPVVYTQRNNVRKPKGSAVGAVVLDREETIMIQPGLPAEYKSLDD
jgi:predicted ribosome quality control (RQC) complex YloA/Tae2 family protein